MARSFCTASKRFCGELALSGHCVNHSLVLIMMQF
jgi:hypothetical protein